MGLIPFFVADRPVSLRILLNTMKEQPEKQVGIMTHAFTSEIFWNAIYDFPDLGNPKVSAKRRALLKKNVIKMADSGIFGKDGCALSYQELFMRYKQMGAEFGIIKDVIGNARLTCESAMEALQEYNKNRENYNFKLVAVAQGKNLEDYCRCYQRLQKHFDYIAIGGLLRKIKNTARYVSVRDNNFLFQILRTIKEQFNPEWLFALGCYHPSRHKTFEEIGVWGSDYKGWIFNYREKINAIAKSNNTIWNFEQFDGFQPKLKKQILITKKLENKLETKKQRWHTSKIKPTKLQLFHEIKVIKQDLVREYEKLLELRMDLKTWEEFSTEYMESFNTFKDALSHSEQTWRFLEVRSYLLNNVYSQIQD